MYVCVCHLSYLFLQLYVYACMYVCIYVCIFLVSLAYSGARKADQ